MLIQIPESFVLLGHRYMVEFDSKLYENERIHGDVDPEKKLIRLQSAGPVDRLNDDGTLNETIVVSEDDVVETFYHELTHIILFSMGEDRLYENERFVSLFGRCLFEVKKTEVIEGQSD